MSRLPPRRPPPPPRPSVPGRSQAGPVQPQPVAAVEEAHALPQTFFIGRYRVVDEIGIGGMASVHLARVDGPGGFQKWVAIKRIHPHLVEDDQFVDMFLDEARIAAGINHANVAQVFDLGKDESTYWIAMEYLHGEPLRELMRRLDERTQYIPFGLAAKIVADAAEGLHGAHELRGRNGQLLNLVHRDVTPHNLFVTYDGYTKVVDFGIAKVIDRLASTRAGTLKGKLAYMSPEQVRGQDVDRRTDIFALGVVLWELTTNKRLFRMDTDLDTLEKVQACIVPLPSQIVQGYPRDLEEVVMRALAQRPEDRYQSARDFSRALQGFLMRQGTFIGPEDVGEYMKGMFQDRVHKREKYLEWAAEVTSTIDVDALRAKAQQTPASGMQAELQQAQPPSQSHVQPTGGAPAQQQPPPQQPQQPPPQQVRPPVDMAATSLMDEDEDIPTRVAASGESPLGGLPSTPGALPSGPGGAPVPSWPGAAGAAQPPRPPGADEADEDDDMNATIALADNPQAQEIRAEIDAIEQQRAAGYPQQQAQPAQPAAPVAPQPQYAPTPTPGQMAAPVESAPMMPGMGAEVYDESAVVGAQPGQSNIETKMSMPRPAAVSQWIAEQGALENPGPRSTPVLMAIALLSTLCVIGVGALVAYKIRVGDQAASVQATSAPTHTHAPLAPETSGSPTSTGTARTTAGSSTGRSKPRPTAGGSKGTGKPSTSPKPTTTATKDEAEPGFLTVYCTPACDQVVAGGRALGASPVVNASMPPGQHRVTLKRSGGPTKVISVIIVSGQVTSQRVSMK